MSFAYSPSTSTGGSTAVQLARVRVILTADEPVTHNTITAIPWDSAVIDTDGLATIGVAGKVLTAQWSSTWLVTFRWNWTDSTGMTSYIVIVDQLDSGNNLKKTRIYETADIKKATGIISGTMNLDSGDYIRVRVQQNNSGSFTRNLDGQGAGLGGAVLNETFCEAVELARA